MTGRCECRCYQCSFIYKTVSHFFEILIFSQDIWGNVRYVPEINLISRGTLIKAFYLPNKTVSKKSKTSFPVKLRWKPFISQTKQLKRNKRYGFADKRQLKIITPKKSFPRISLVHFSSSKLVHFFKCSFREICFSDMFGELHFFSIVNV